MQETQTMAKTKIDDLPKGAEEMDAEEQKAAKGGATVTEFASLAASQVGAQAAATAASPTLSQPLAASETLGGRAPSRPPSRPRVPRNQR